MNSGLRCPKCRSRISEHTLTSNPVLYEADCASGCGFELRYYNRANKFSHITQAELNDSLVAVPSKTVEEKLKIAKAELRECYVLLKSTESAISDMNNAVTALNDARHDGRPVLVFAAYTNAFSVCDKTNKVLAELRSKLEAENNLWNKI